MPKKAAKASKSIDWREIACRDPQRTPYPDAFILDGRLARLMAVFEAIRWACGSTPITIGSAYRTTAWNQIQKGSPSSRHLTGEALDLYTPRTMSLADFHARVMELANGPLRSSIGAVGLYDWGVHVDIRPRTETRLAQWDLRSSEPVRA